MFIFSPFIAIWRMFFPLTGVDIVNMKSVYAITIVSRSSVNPKKDRKEKIKLIKKYKKYIEIPFKQNGIFKTNALKILASHAINGFHSSKYDPCKPLTKQIFDVLKNENSYSVTFVLYNAPEKALYLGDYTKYTDVSCYNITKRFNREMEKIILKNTTEEPLYCFDNSKLLVDCYKVEDEEGSIYDCRCRRNAKEIEIIHDGTCGRCGMSIYEMAPKNIKANRKIYGKLIDNFLSTL